MLVLPVLQTTKRDSPRAVKMGGCSAYCPAVPEPSANTVLLIRQRVQVMITLFRHNWTRQHVNTYCIPLYWRSLHVVNLWTKIKCTLRSDCMLII